MIFENGEGIEASAVRIRSVNVGPLVPTDASSTGATAIRKHPQTAPIHLTSPGDERTSGLAGDAIGDPRHHGGADQAVYAYAREDLDWWQDELGRSLGDGWFGENITTVGLDLSAVRIGQRLRVGQALLEVSRPRIPCRTFAAHMQMADWVRRFTQARRPGAYLRVLEPGQVAQGARIQLLPAPAHDVTIEKAFRALTTDSALLPQLLAAGDALTEKDRVRALTRRDRLADDDDQE